ncbi:MAG TPA: amino acid adenylation domain-containing protein [Pyrinomonadaceae bacterium]|nr:amino acid adenylation domain-containing protein [Pyrinomonadaceae bacterium]
MRHEGVHELFSAKAQDCASHVAIEGGARRLTYGELEGAANALANLLISFATPRGSLVAILSDDSVANIVGMIGILKAGCVFVPLDPKIPQKRLQAIIAETSPEWFVTESKFFGTLGDVMAERAAQAKVISLDEGLTDVEPHPYRFARLEAIAADRNTDSVAVAREADEMAYIYFTSGSTGRPKGIAGRLKGIDHFIRWEIKTFGVTEGTRVSQLTLPSFDAFLRDTFTPLCAGGTVCVPSDRELLLNPAALAEWIDKERINIIHCVPSLFRLFSGRVSDSESFAALRYVLLSGERVLPADVRRWVEVFGERIPLVNLYGPTETTMTKFFYVIKPEDKDRRSIPIGKPMEGARAIVVNELGAICPPGTVGEIYIRTPYRTLGYYQQPELTKEVFFQNPFNNDARDIVYRTGDLGRVLEDGNFEFIGRKDQQVKIRGVRIELSEIENLLREHEAVQDVAVTAQNETSDNNYLCAYVVLAGDTDASALREHLAQSLPAYMMPSAFVKMEALPRTATGKVDRHALPALSEALKEAKEARIAPRTPVEEGLAGIWSQFLDVPRLSVHDNFFALGGHSLLAMQLLSRVRDAFQVEVALRNFFESPTVAGLAGHVEAALRSAAGTTAPPIGRVERNGEAALSFAQQRLWFLDYLEPGNPAYNISSAVRLSGTLDHAALERAFTEILRRHEVLRTTFADVEGTPVQTIAKTLPVPLTMIDLSQLAPDEREERALRLKSEEARRPFDLRRGPLLRVTLLRMSEREHVALLTMHHIISDDWSMGVLIGEIGKLYEAFVNGEPSPLPELAVQYADYAHWQQQWLRGEVLETHLDYWRQKLGGGQTPVLRLPTVRPRPAVQTFRGARETLSLSQELTDALKEFCLRQNVTMFMTLLAAFKTLLYRYTNQEEITVGSPIANRNRSEIEPLIGFFVNTLVLRTDLSGELTFAQLLERVRDASLAAYAHQDLPFEKIVDALQPTRDLSHTPLFQVMFTLQNIWMPTLESSSLKMDFLDSHTGTAKFDLELILVDRGGEALFGALEYNTDLFDAETARRLLGHFRQLLESIVANPQQKLADLPLLAEDERRRMLVEWNDSAISYPLDSCIHELFEAQVERTPEAIAVTFHDEQLTYAQLNARVNKLAHALVEHGVGAEVIVALLAERGIDFLTAVLAIFKAGGAYVPLDPAHPTPRLRSVLAESRSSLVLSTREFVPALSDALTGLSEERPELLLIEKLLEGERPVENLPRRCAPANLAYVIFTSGSTGVPKGAMVEHRGMLNHLYAKITDLKLTGADTVAQTASQCFDISVWQFLAALLVGGRVCVFDDEAAHDAARLLEEIRRQRINIFETVPTLLRATLNHSEASGAERLRLDGLRWMLVTGEALPPDICRQWLDVYPEVPLMNAYGPTECSDDVTHCVISVPPSAEVAHMPIGRPVSNMKLYILDARLNPVPVGVSGELYVGGVGVGRGYLNNARQTAQVFIPHPFSEVPGARLYKTGDLARFLPDGQIEFLGRIDYQVKIRGFRIELGEIETALAAHPAVHDAVVLVREDVPGDKRLVAYVVPAGDERVSTSELRNFLKQRLPEYMSPSAFVVLDALPLTSNGKVDRKALPAPEGERPELNAEFSLPRTTSEAQLVDIWQQVLRVERVGIHDNFFELGGDSILMIQIISKANAVGLHLTLRQFFQHQTVAELAALVSDAQHVHAEQGIVTGDVPLTPVQHWLVEQNLADLHHFNLALMLEVPSSDNSALWSEVVRQLLSHHDALRLRFDRQETGWRQFNDAPGETVPFSWLNLAEMPEQEQSQAIERAAAELQASLNLSAGPIVRIALFHLGANQRGRLLIVIHHMAIDGVSWRILIEDLMLAHEQLSRGETVRLPSKTTSFKRWAERLDEHARSLELQQEASYWLSEPRRRVRRLPLDFPHGLNTVDSTRFITRTLTNEETRLLLQSVPAVFHTQIDEVLLTALAQTFKNWTGKRRLLVDVEGHGREDLFTDADLSRTVGWFTAIYPVLLDLGESVQIEDALRAVSEQLRAVPNQGIGYGLLRYLAADAGTREMLGQLPPSEVIFNYLGQFDNNLTEASSAWGLASESIGSVRSPRQQRRYLLEITGSVSGERLHLTWKYSENIHKRATVERLANGYTHALQSIIKRHQAHAAPPRAEAASDFPGIDLNQEKLDKILSELKLNG